MLSVGFSNGQIVNYTLEIESYVLNNDTDTSVSPNGSNGNNLIQKKCKSVQNFTYLFVLNLVSTRQKEAETALL